MSNIRLKIIVAREIEKIICDDGMNAIILNTEREFSSYDFYKKNGFEEINGLAVLAK